MLPLTRYSLRLIRAFRHQFPHHITGHADPSDGESRTSNRQYTPVPNRPCVDWTAQQRRSLSCPGNRQGPIDGQRFNHILNVHSG